MFNDVLKKKKAIFQAGSPLNGPFFLLIGELSYAPL